MVQTGDRISLESEKVGQQPRQGVVLSVDGAKVRVRWESGQESTFIPSGGSLTVIGRQEHRS